MTETDARLKEIREKLRWYDKTGYSFSPEDKGYQRDVTYLLSLLDTRDAEINEYTPRWGNFWRGENEGV